MNGKGNGVIGVNLVVISKGPTGTSRLAEQKGPMGATFGVALRMKTARKTVGLLGPCCIGVVRS